MNKPASSPPIFGNGKLSVRSGSLATLTICQSGRGISSSLPCKSIHLKAETLKTIREGMKQACESGGTGWPLFNFGVKDDNSTTSGQLKRIYVGCKTGTAENPAGELPHAWFTVFAPFDKPEIALTVLVENSGEGSNVAAPIAKEILKYYFERNQ